MKLNLRVQLEVAHTFNSLLDPPAPFYLDRLDLYVFIAVALGAEQVEFFDRL
jgi:hypothetical protein